MTIYIDDDYKCYVSAADGRRAIETNEFNGKCDEWIESYRLVPAGKTWTREDGEVFKGEMVAPWKDLGEAYAAQAGYVTRKLPDLARQFLKSRLRHGLRAAVADKHAHQRQQPRDDRACYRLPHFPSSRYVFVFRIQQSHVQLRDVCLRRREHNNFARRVPVVEEQIRVMDRRMTALEKNKEQGE